MHSSIFGGGSSTRSPTSAAQRTPLLKPAHGNANAIGFNPLSRLYATDLLGY